MKLQGLFENQYKNIKLAKIRLKVDPANNNIPYEGFFLQENQDGTIDMAVITPGAPMAVLTVQPKQIDLEKSLSSIDKLKLLVAHTIKDKGIVSMIKDLNSISDIEATLLGNGCTFEDLYEIFKKYLLITGSLNEGFLSSIGKGYNAIKNASQKFKDFSTGDLSALAPQGVKNKQTTQPKDVEQLGHFSNQTAIYDQSDFDEGKPMLLNKHDWDVTNTDQYQIVSICPKTDEDSRFITKVFDHTMLLRLFPFGKPVHAKVIEPRTAKGFKIAKPKNHVYVDPRSIAELKAHRYFSHRLFQPKPVVPNQNDIKSVDKSLRKTNKVIQKHTPKILSQPKYLTPKSLKPRKT